MSRIFSILVLVSFFISCTSKDKIPVMVWTGGPGEASDAEILEKFNTFKEHGIDGVMYNGGQNPEIYKRVGKLAKDAGLEFHTWIPTMIQSNNSELKPEWYMVNRLGESAYDKPVYVPYYKILCPSREEVYNFLSNMYTKVAEVPEVEGIHLDYIRFPDVILAEGLWEKYGLVMDKEYPKYDYCYCDVCTSNFKEKTGIDIKEVEDPSQVEEWKQFRYDLITSLVNRLAADVHETGKQITSAVFPGPSISKKLVRQEWNKWNVDAIYPMNYNDFYLKDAKWVGDMVKEEVTSVNNKKPIYSGLFITPFPSEKDKHSDPENHGLAPEEMVEAIELSMVNGATGICLFTPERMTDEHWKLFKEAIHKDYSSLVK